MTATHPIHSRPTKELLDAGVTLSQFDALRDLSKATFGDPSRVFEILGYPDSRGDASTMLGAIHAIRSKNPPMPGRQADYAEKLKAAIGNQSAPEEEPQMADTKTCTRCETNKPVDDFNKGQSWCRGCQSEYNRTRGKKKSRSKATRKSSKPEKSKSPQGPAEKSTSDRPTQPDPPLSDANGGDAFTDPRLSDLRAFQAILESTVTAVDSVRLEEAAEALNLIGEHFRRKDDDE